MGRKIPPNIFDHLDKVQSVIQVARLGLLMDFDGTLSEIAPTPEAAVIHPLAVEPLESLSQKLPVVSIVSGRAASVIHDKVGVESAVYVGNHGAESIINGQVITEPQASAYREKLKVAFDYLHNNSDGPGIRWEDKGFSIAVHYRLAPDAVEAQKRLRQGLDSAPFVDELEAFWGRMVLEIRAPTGLNKGYALRKLAKDWDVDTVIFVGDDTTDLDAMLALNELRNKGTLKGFNALVVHENSSKVLLDAADYSLGSVGETAKLLQWLDKTII